MTAVLALVALAGLKPWEADSVDPRLGPLELEMAVGEAVALPAPAVALVAEATVAPEGRQMEVGTSQARSGDLAPGGEILAVAPARAVALAGNDAAPSPEPTPAPVPVVPVPEAQPVAGSAPGTTPTPVATPVPAGEGPSKPIPSGVDPEPSCEDDEYLVTITFLGEEEGEEAPVEILVQRFDEDGETEEVRLEGDLLDAQSLINELVVEGSCVRVVTVPFEGAAGAPPAGEVPGETGEPLEPDVP